MGEIKVYTDEDIDIDFSKALKLRGFEASTALDHERCKSKDEGQLEYATSIGAVLLTHNVQDFPRTHYEFMKDGKHHNGTILHVRVSHQHGRDIPTALFERMLRQANLTQDEFIRIYK